MPEFVSRILAIGLPALVSFYTAACVWALRPRAGTLEWIPACDRPAPPLFGSPYLLELADLPLVLAVFVLTAALWIFGTMQPLAFHFSLPPVELVQSLLKDAAAPAAAAVLSFLLLKRLFGQTVSAAMCAALIAADLSAEPVTLVFSAGSLYFFVCCLTAPEASGLLGAAVPLAGGFACLAVGCYFDPALLMMFPAALFLCAMGCVDRFIQTGRMVLAYFLAGAVLVSLLVWILVYIPAGMREGWTFPSLLIRGDYYKLILRRLRDGLSALYGGWLPLNIVRLRYDWMLLLAGFPALIAAGVELIRDGDRRCLLILAWTVMAVAAFCLLGSHALSLACALCLCRVWARLQENRFHWLACLGAGCLFLFLLTQYVLALGGF